MKASTMTYLYVSVLLQSTFLEPFFCEMVLYTSTYMIYGRNIHMLIKIIVLFRKIAHS